MYIYSFYYLYIYIYIAFHYGDSVGEYLEKISFYCNKRDHGLSGPSGSSMEEQAEACGQLWDVWQEQKDCFENILPIFDFKSQHLRRRM